jgi:hypothetical protein
MLTALTDLRHPALDGFPPAPVISVNVNAPQRIILQAVEELVRQWKKERDIPERRRRDDKLEDYLAVWDLREGWVDDHYDSSREQTMSEVAAHLDLSLSTASNRYRAAFRHIAGHDYAPELWFQLFGFLKLNRFHCSNQPARRALNRPWRSRSRRPVPETTLEAHLSVRSEESFLNALGVSADEIDQVDLMLDIRELIAQGRTNDDIMAILELRPEFGGVIDYLRGRHADQL